MKQAYQVTDKSLKYQPISIKDEAKGLQLLVGSSMGHFGTTSTFAPAMLEVEPEALLSINPDDAKEVGITDGGRLTVLGAASAFEGTVNFRFLDSEQSVLYQNYTMSTQGMAWGAIGICVDPAIFDVDPAVLEVFLVSMKDGSDFVVTPVPIER